jgi:hypothetical protein
LYAIGIYIGISVKMPFPSANSQYFMAGLTLKIAALSNLQTKRQRKGTLS